MGPQHRLSNTPEYWTLKGMIARCYNPKRTSYPHYGGRGITVCKRWLGPKTHVMANFAVFYKDMGPRPGPGYQIDRIDNSKGYSPKNCRWVTCTQNNRNKRTNKDLTFRGQTKRLKVWAKEIRVPYFTLVARLRAGWSTKRALTTPRTKVKRSR